MHNGWRRRPASVVLQANCRRGACCSACGRRACSSADRQRSCRRRARHQRGCASAARTRRRAACCCSSAASRRAAALPRRRRRGALREHNDAAGLLDPLVESSSTARSGRRTTTSSSCSAIASARDRRVQLGAARLLRHVVQRRARDRRPADAHRQPWLRARAVYRRGRRRTRPARWCRAARPPPPLAAATQTRLFAAARRLGRAAGAFRPTCRRGRAAVSAFTAASFHSDYTAPRAPDGTPDQLPRRLAAGGPAAVRRCRPPSSPRACCTSRARSGSARSRRSF